MHSQLYGQWPTSCQNGFHCQFSRGRAQEDNEAINGGGRKLSSGERAWAGLHGCSAGKTIQWQHHKREHIHFCIGNHSLPHAVWTGLEMLMLEFNAFVFKEQCVSLPFLTQQTNLVAPLTRVREAPRILHARICLQISVTCSCFQSRSNA